MVQKAKTQSRGRIPHKLAKYVRALPVNLLGSHSTNGPSTSHLSNYFINIALGGPHQPKIKNNQNTWYPADD